MAKDFAAMEDSNRSSNPSIHEMSDPARRVVLRGGFGLALGAALAPLAGCAIAPGAPADTTLGFNSVAPSTADAVVVPEGYTATPLAPWGEPVGIAGAMPAWRPDASSSAAEQAVQMGMHHDGMQFFALGGSSRRGLLVTNHEYTDDGLLHPGGLSSWSAEKVAKSQASHGISVIEVALDEAGGRGWQMVRPSRYARRITARTPFALGGPAAGHALMKTAADPAGRRVLGTFANCAAGMTPWGTFLSGEENFQDYFVTADQATAHEKRWGLRKASWYRWPEFDERFDTVRHPNEPNRFGWVVELDPMDPASTPIKRTALGRAAHEGAWVAVTRDGRAVVYSGEDARFEYIYKFVSRDAIQAAGHGLSAAQANAELLDHGTLYVARFDADGSGRWLPLVHGQGSLTPARGFADQGEVLVKARQASDALGATKMDRPEWLAIDQTSRWVYATLTNNSARGTGTHPGPDAANPRARNDMGQIIRWREEADFDATHFEWNHLLLAGDPANERPEARGNVKGDAFACPDTLAFDPRGVLWIGTDVGSKQMNRGEMVRLGNNQLLACDPATGEVRRFLVGPVNSELTAATWAPDGRTLFVNIQHPGETPSARSDPTQPRQYSNWPDFDPAGRPRSATLAIRKRDGGVIGT
ncbi:MAG: PhoX family phosphatase [Rubrivivax sp.]|nr:PhoX family phosphatase [Rubrivivax sp.]